MELGNELISRRGELISDFFGCFFVVAFLGYDFAFFFGGGGRVLGGVFRAVRRCIFAQREFFFWFFFLLFLNGGLPPCRLGGDYFEHSRAV